MSIDTNSLCLFYYQHFYMLNQILLAVSFTIVTLVLWAYYSSLTLHAISSLLIRLFRSWICRLKRFSCYFRSCKKNILWNVRKHLSDTGQNRNRKRNSLIPLYLSRCSRKQKKMKSCQSEKLCGLRRRVVYLSFTSFFLFQIKILKIDKNYW